MAKISSITFNKLGRTYAMYIVFFLLVVFIFLVFLIIFVFTLFYSAYYFFSRSFYLLDILLFLFSKISVANYYVLASK